MEPGPAPLPTFPVTRYRVERLLARGGMGEVLLARDLELDRPVAIKRNLRPANPVGRERFRREARALAALEHPGVVRVLDFGEAAGHLFLVTEFLEGASLSAWPEDADPLPPMLQAAEALEALHAAGILHRDLKPDNLFHTRDGRTVLIDFGLVLDPERTRLTEEDIVLGSVSFMAPEVLRGEAVGPAADWFGWGATLFWLVERSFPQTWTRAVRIANSKEVPALPLTRVSSGSPAARLIRAAMAEDPAARPTRVADLHRLLRSPRRPGEPAAGPPRGRAAGALAWVAALTLLLLLGLLAPGGGPTPPVAPPAPPVAPHPHDPPELGARLGQQLSTLELPDDPDPALLLELSTRLPALGEAFDRVAEQGAASLPAALVEALVDLDVRFSARGLPRPFGPTLGPTGRGATRPAPFRFLPDHAQLAAPWTGAAAEAADRAEAVDRLRAAGEEAMRHFYLTGELPPGMPRLPGVVPLFGQVGLNHWLETAITKPEHRAGIAAWLRGAAEEMRRTVALVGQTLRDEPELADQRALAFVAWHQYVKPLALSEVAFFPPQYLLRGPPRTPGGWFFQGVLAASMARTRRRAGMPWRPLAVSASADLRRALTLPAPPGSPPPLIDRRRRLALERALDELIGLDERELAMATYRQHARLVDPDVSLKSFTSVVLTLEASWLRGMRDPEVRRDVDRLLERVDAAPRRLQGPDHQELRAALVRLRDARRVR